MHINKAAVARSQFFEYSPKKLYVIRGSVFHFWSVRTTDGSKKSFQIQITFKTDTNIKAVFNSGIIILKNSWKNPQPSIAAASSNSFGMFFMNPCNIKIEKPTPKPIYIIIRPIGFKSLIFLKTIKRGSIVLWNGIKIEIESKQNITLLVLVFVLTKIHAAIVENNKIKKTEIIVIAKEFKKERRKFNFKNAFL